MVRITENKTNLIDRGRETGHEKKKEKKKKRKEGQEKSSREKVKR